jgi:hypothetical protein
MQFQYSQLIDKFQEALGTQKELINEVFNKPDATDVVSNKYISIKNFGDFYLLIIFEVDDQIARFFYAYRIYQKLLDVNIGKMKPIEMLTEFMNKYGVSKTIPGVGEHKIMIENKLSVFFPGILNVEKYLEDLKNV